MSFPSVLRRTIGQNVLGLLYNSLLSFKMIINNNFLKCEDQYLRSMYGFSILTMLAIHSLLPTNTLKCFQETWSEPGVNELLHLLIVLTNLEMENGGYSTC